MEKERKNFLLNKINVLADRLKEPLARKSLLETIKKREAIKVEMHEWSKIKQEKIRAIQDLYIQKERYINEINNDKNLKYEELKELLHEKNRHTSILSNLFVVIKSKWEELHIDELIIENDVIVYRNLDAYRIRRYKLISNWNEIAIEYRVAVVLIVMVFSFIGILIMRYLLFLMSDYGGAVFILMYWLGLILFGVFGTVVVSIRRYAEKMTFHQKYKKTQDDVECLMKELYEMIEQYNEKVKYVHDIDDLIINVKGVIAKIEYDVEHCGEELKVIGDSLNTAIEREGYLIEQLGFLEKKETELTEDYVSLRENNKLLKQNVDFWLKLSGHQFEYEVAELLKKNGFDAHVTKGSDDKGIDIIINLNEEIVPIQCKNHSTKISPGGIRDFQGALLGLENISKSIFISSMGFSFKAQKQAKITNTYLMDVETIVGINNDDIELIGELKQYLYS